MPFTIKDQEDLGLCQTCSRAHIREGDRLRDVRVTCGADDDTPVTFIVRHCTDYNRRNELDRFEMSEIAWVLEVKKGRVIGFRPPKGQRDDGE